MASTSRDAEGTKEYFDSPTELEAKVTQLAEWIKQSRHFIVFTGAGISTSAGIPDFRSGMHTKLETGPGVWELRAKGASRDAKKYKTTTTAKAIPTKTHMSIVQLVRSGKLKAVISQNTDGLHRRSGVPVNKLFELHGNSNVEKCMKCKKEYLRDFRTRTSTVVSKHKTGRKCDNPVCRGDLKDSIINFGENLPEAVLDAGFDHAEKADLCLAMGSSLTVTPAADIPEIVGKKNRLVIVNLQKTPLDSLASLRINGKCDVVMSLLMSKLSADIPQFRLKRKVVMKSSKKGDKYEVCVEGRDQEGHPFSFIRSVSFTGAGSPSIAGQEPFTAVMSREAKVVIMFTSHYGEPSLEFSYDVTKCTTVTVDLEYNPMDQTWTVTRSDEDKPYTTAGIPAQESTDSPSSSGKATAKVSPGPAGRAGPKVSPGPSRSGTKVSPGPSRSGTKVSPGPSGGKAATGSRATGKTTGSKGATIAKASGKSGSKVGKTPVPFGHLMDMSEIAHAKTTMDDLASEMDSLSTLK